MMADGSVEDQIGRRLCREETHRVVDVDIADVEGDRGRGTARGDEPDGQRDGEDRLKEAQHVRLRIIWVNKDRGMEMPSAPSDRTSASNRAGTLRVSSSAAA